MEFELKLQFKTKDGAKRLLEDKEIMGNANKIEKIAIKAKYFDTEDFILRKHHFALRKREEGNKLFATVKSKGTQMNGLSNREEYNIEIIKNSKTFEKDLSHLPIGEKIINLIKGKELKTFVLTDYIRNKFILNMFGCKAEVAVDSGEIIAGGKSENINEVEIEFISGDKKGIMKIGEYFKSRYPLEAGNLSKYDRGIALLFT